MFIYFNLAMTCLTLLRKDKVKHKYRTIVLMVKC